MMESCEHETKMIEGNRNYGGGDRDDRMLRDVDIEDNG